MPKYRVYFPITRLMPPIDFVVSGSTAETPKEEALWHYNKAREHDGLPPVKICPPGTRMIRIDI